MNFKRLSLTDIKIDIKRVPKKKDLIKAMEAAGRLFIYQNNFLLLLLLLFFKVLFVVIVPCVNWFCLHLIDVKGKWEKSSWGRKLIVRKRRAALNDFDRFKIMLAKIKVCVLLLLLSLILMKQFYV